MRRRRAASSLPLKQVYFNGVRIGEACTWLEVAELLSMLLERPMTLRDVQEQGNEGPTGFYVLIDH